MLILCSSSSDENAVPSKFGASDIQDLIGQSLNAYTVQNVVVVLHLVLRI
jgi:hypothetical protein